MHRLASFRTRPLQCLPIRQHASIRDVPPHVCRHPHPTKLHLQQHRRLLTNSTTQPIPRNQPSLPITIPIHSSLLSSLRAYLLGIAIFLSSFFGYLYVTDTCSSIHLLTPSILAWIYDDAEDAHEAGNAWLHGLYTVGLHPRERRGDKAGGTVAAADLSIEVFGHTLDNPIGTSAGIDKHAEIPDALFALGPAIVEVGGATPEAQPGNARPRVFRLPSQNGLVNRYGLNSYGADDMARRLRRRVRSFAIRMGIGNDEEAERIVLDGLAGVPAGSLTRGKLLAVQVSKNKGTDERDVDAVRRDYVYCVERLARYADIIVVNVSSPNTPGLRTLQRTDPLTKILTAVVSAAHSTNRASPPAVMVKVSPDEDTPSQISGIATAVWASGVDGVIVGNTTKRRDHIHIHTSSSGESGLDAKEAAAYAEEGGYSGPQLFPQTLDLVRRYREALDNHHPSLSSPSPSSPSSSSLPSQPQNQTQTQTQDKKIERKVIFATGGITTGAQALSILAAGASVAQVYTAMVYGGAGTVTRMKGEIGAEMARIRREASDRDVFVEEEEELKREEREEKAMIREEERAEKRERQVEDYITLQKR